MKFIITFLILYTTSLTAEPLKVALIVPDGTNWASSLKKFSKEVQAETKDTVQFRFLFGGVAGTDDMVLESLTKQQLAGALFSGAIVSKIYQKARFAEVPFRYGGDRKKAWKEFTAKLYDLRQGFLQQGYYTLGLFEVGSIYMVSTKEISKFSDIENAPVWQWPKDPLVKSILTHLKAKPVEAEMPDVLEKINANAIQIAYGPPMGILALQWASKAKFILDYPLSFGTGVFLIRQDEWKKVSTPHKIIVQKLADKYLKEANQQVVLDNEQAFADLKKSGVKLLPLSKGEEKRAKEVATLVAKDLGL